MNGTYRTLEGQTVLVVEDQYYVALEMKHLVAQFGGVVMGPAKDVATAMILLDDRPRPDLAILDVNLDGARVYPLAERLSAIGTPFVFATGYESWAIDPRFAETPLMTKPVTAASLGLALGQLNSRPLEGAA